jgi:hypothetical protein
MNSVLKKVLFAVLLLPILLILVSLFLPATYRVERSLAINAAPEIIFPYLNELRRWPEWTAWNTNREPSLVYIQAGPPSGVGAVQSWTARSGNGSIKLTESDPDRGIGYELNFNEGRFISTGRIDLVPVTNGTRVVWSNYGNFGRNPVGRYLGLLMDKWMGNDFETGLQNLKAKTQRQPPATNSIPPR